jgi:hypothetical protein
LAFKFVLLKWNNFLKQQFSFTFFLFEQTNGVLGATIPNVHKAVVEVFKQNIEIALLP